MMMKSGLDIFYFEIPLAPSEIPARPIEPFWVNFLHWAEGASKTK